MGSRRFGLAVHARPPGSRWSRRAEVATARKMAVLCWHLVTNKEDYAFTRFRPPEGFTGSPPDHVAHSNESKCDGMSVAPYTPGMGRSLVADRYTMRPTPTMSMTAAVTKSSRAVSFQSSTTR